MPDFDDAALRAILRETRTIALVGASINPERESNVIMKYLMNAGYRVVPVNPSYTQVLRQRCFPAVRAIGEPVDLVNVFRRSEAVPAVLEDAAASGVRTVWLQLGVRHAAAEAAARKQGLNVVVNRCIAIEHQRLMT